MGFCEFQGLDQLLQIDLGLLDLGETPVEQFHPEHPRISRQMNAEDLVEGDGAPGSASNIESRRVTVS
jgi:hypothetical protein